jgi:hypothetical protein
MNWQSSRRAGGAKGRFVPRLEVLEDRQLLTANFTVAGNTLIIQAPTTNRSPGESVTVTDNGGTGINNIVAVSGAPFVPNVHIDNVFFSGGRGNDRFSYNLTAELNGNRLISVDLGAGNNRFSATVRRDLLARSNLNVNVVSGAGIDNLRMTQIGGLQAGAIVAFSADAGAGDDVINFQTTSFVAINSGACIFLTLNGGAGTDHVNAIYAGRQDGTLALTADGGAGNDNVFTDFEIFPGSVGVVAPGRVGGGAGNDNLTYIVHNRGRGFSANQVVDGGNGIDRARRTNDVVQLNCEIDIVVA